MPDATAHAVVAGLTGQPETKHIQFFRALPDDRHFILNFSRLS